MSKKAINRVFSNRNELIDNYTDFPGTKMTVKKIKEQVSDNQWEKLEDLFFDATGAFEEQGFIYGFRYAVELLMEGGV